MGYSNVAPGGLRSAFLWTAADGMVSLWTLGGDQSIALHINDFEKVVGYGYTALDVNHAFLWTAADGMDDLGTLGGEHRGQRISLESEPRVERFLMAGQHISSESRRFLIATVLAPKTTI